MSQIFRAYQKVLARYPLGIQALQTGVLMGIGDQVAQNFIEKKRFKDLDFQRTVSFASLGIIFVGPACKTWYGLLDKVFGGKGSRNTIAIKKVLCDQLLFAPILIFSIVSSIGFIQGLDVPDIRAKLENQYTDIVKANWKIWPMVQLLNFSFTPLQYQVLVVQTVSIFWNTYLSYKANTK